MADATFLVIAISCTELDVTSSHMPPFEVCYVLQFLNRPYASVTRMVVVCASFANYRQQLTMESIKSRFRWRRDSARTRIKVRSTTSAKSAS
jgi:hypothetical protein